MSRKEQLENIIIGTLLESTERRNYFDDCRCVLTADMFINEKNRKIYNIVSDMNRQGKVNTDPCTIFEEYGEAVSDIVYDMVALCTDYSFLHLKTEYNERLFLHSCMTGEDYKRNDVQFSDYVRQFIINVYSNERKAS